MKRHLLKFWEEDRSATLIGLLWLMVYPFLRSRNYTHLTRDKWEGMLVLTAVTLLVFCIGSICCKKTGKDDTDNPRLSPGILFAIAYFTWVGLSAVFGTLHTQRNESGSLAVLFGSKRYEGLITQLCYCVIFFAMARKKPNRKVIEIGCTLGLLLYGFIVFLQYAGYNPFGLFPEGLSVRTNPAFQGPIGNVDLASGYVVLMCGFLFAAFLQSHSEKWFCYISALIGVFLEACFDVQSGAVALLTGIAVLLFQMLRAEELRYRIWLILAGVCGAYLVRSLVLFPWADDANGFAWAPFRWKQGLLLIAFLLCGGMAARRKQNSGKVWSRRKMLVLCGFLLAALVIFLFFLPVEETEGQNPGFLAQLQLTARGQGKDSFGSWRLGVWRMTCRLSREHLLFGTGPDTFWFAFNPAWEEYEAELYRAGAIEGALENFDNPHNEYLAVLSNNGIPALICYLALLITVCTDAFTQRTGKLRKEAAAGVVLYGIQSCFSFSICLVAPMFWVVLGIAAENE